MKATKEKINYIKNLLWKIYPVLSLLSSAKSAIIQYASRDQAYQAKVALLLTNVILYLVVCSHLRYKKQLICLRFSFCFHKLVIPLASLMAHTITQ